MSGVKWSWKRRQRATTEVMKRHSFSLVSSWVVRSGVRSRCCSGPEISAEPQAAISPMPLKLHPELRFDRAGFRLCVCVSDRESVRNQSWPMCVKMDVCCFWNISLYRAYLKSIQYKDCVSLFFNFYLKVWGRWRPLMRMKDEGFDRHTHPQTGNELVRCGRHVNGILER